MTPKRRPLLLQFQWYGSKERIIVIFVIFVFIKSMDIRERIKEIVHLHIPSTIIPIPNGSHLFYVPFPFTTWTICNYGYPEFPILRSIKQCLFFVFLLFLPHTVLPFIYISPLGKLLAVSHCLSCFHYVLYQIPKAFSPHYMSPKFQLSLWDSK